MDVLLKLFLIQFCIVFITGYSGFPDEFIIPKLKKWLGFGEVSKIFVCELCQTTWVGLLYLLFTGHFTLPFIAFNFLMAALTPVTLNIMHTMIDFFQGCVNLFRHITGLDLK